IGGSYGGGIDPNVAEADARVRAIIPARTWGSLQFALDPNNIVVPGDPTGFSHQLVDQGVFKFEWTSLFFALGNSGPARGPGGYQSHAGRGEVYDGRLRTVAEMDASYLPQRELVWFDHYLKHLSVSSGPGFSWFRDYVTNPGLSDASAAWGSSPAYPAM